jgi:hypothetical protein
MSEKKETYLGDGLYASFDGYEIELRAPRLEGDHKVYLDGVAILNFIEFLQSKCSIDVEIKGRGR